MRKSIDRLSILVADLFQKNPIFDYLFVFRNRYGDKIKILYWNYNGYCLFYKRLEREKFKFLVCFDGCFEITTQQLNWLLGKAMGYALNHWELLIRYLDNGKLKLDNNAVENVIRLFALGRRNWLFCGNEKGEKSSAIIYSMIETSKANQIAPEKYLQYLLEKLLDCKTDFDYEDLFPEKYKSQHGDNSLEETMSATSI